MKKIYCLRKKGTDEVVYVLASTPYRAVFTAGGGVEDWEVMGSHSIKSFERNEKLYQDIYKREAKKRWGKEPLKNDN